MWTSLGDHYSSYNNKGGDRFREGKDLTQTTQQLVEVSELDVRPRSGVGGGGGRKEGIREEDNADQSCTLISRIEGSRVRFIGRDKGGSREEAKMINSKENKPTLLSAVLLMNRSSVSSVLQSVDIINYLITQIEPQDPTGTHLQASEPGGRRCSDTTMECQTSWRRRLQVPPSPPALLRRSQLVARQTVAAVF